MKLFTRLAAAASMLFALSVQGEALVVVDNANPPFMYKDGTEARGLYPSILTAIFQRMNEPLSIMAVPWKRALNMGENSEAGIGGIYKNSERLKIYDYSSALFEEKLLLYTLKSSKLDFKGVSDLHGKKVGVIRGWSYGEEFDRGRAEGKLEAQEAKSDEANFKKLSAGRIDYVIAIELSGQQLIPALGLQDQVVALSLPLTVNPTYLVFNKNANAGELLKSFDAALAAAQADGSLEQIIKAPH